MVEAPRNLPSEEFDVSLQSELARALLKRSVKHWDSGLNYLHNPNSSILYSLRTHTKDLQAFQRYIFREQQKARSKNTQEVILVPNLIGTLELPIMINGAPILLVQPNMRFIMEDLLNGGFVDSDYLKDFELDISDVDTDTHFLNRCAYFH